MAPLPVGQGSKEPARGGVLGVSSATSFFLEFPLSEGEQERWRFSSALLFSCIFLLLCLPYYGISRLFLWLVLLSIRLLLFHKRFQLR